MERYRLRVGNLEGEWLTAAQPLPPSLLAALRAHKEAQRQKWPDADYVFISTAGTPIEPMNLTNHFKSVLEHAGLPKLRLHDLRHSYATLQIALGTHPRVLKEAMGHAEFSTTMDIYGSVLDETLRQANDKLDSLLTAGEEERSSQDKADGTADEDEPSKEVQP